jgi:hypothetical protein
MAVGGAIYDDSVDNDALPKAVSDDFREPRPEDELSPRKRTGNKKIRILVEQNKSHQH